MATRASSSSASSSASASQRAAAAGGSLSRGQKRAQSASEGGVGGVGGVDGVVQDARTVGGGAPSAGGVESSESMTVGNYSFPKAEFVRLLLQAVNGLGYSGAAAALEEER